MAQGWRGRMLRQLSALSASNPRIGKRSQPPHPARAHTRMHARTHARTHACTQSHSHTPKHTQTRAHGTSCDGHLACSVSCAAFRSATVARLIACNMTRGTTASPGLRRHSDGASRATHEAPRMRRGGRLQVMVGDKTQPPLTLQEAKTVRCPIPRRECCAAHERAAHGHQNDQATRNGARKSTRRRCRSRCGRAGTICLCVAHTAS